MVACLFQFARAGRAAWPDLDIPERELVAFLRARAHVHIDDARAADLAIACACAGGDGRAIAVFERVYFGEVETAAALARAGREVANEAKQILRQILFIPGPRRAPALAGYSGRGDLRGWRRVTATREVLRLLARARRDLALDDGALLEAIAPTADPELGYLREVYRDELAAAFRVALASLGPRARGLLRCVVIDRMGVEALGRLHGVHKGTASRWLIAAREELRARTRAELSRRLAVTGGEVDSIIRLLHSRIDVSLERLLR